MPFIDLTARELQEILFLLNSNTLEDNKKFYAQIADKIELILENFNENPNVDTDPCI